MEMRRFDQRSKLEELSGKKALRPSDTVIELVIVDATEQPIECPKKNNVGTIAVRRNDTSRKRK
jgi:hypothetical protein